MNDDDQKADEVDYDYEEVDYDDFMQDFAQVEDAGVAEQNTDDCVDQQCFNEDPDQAQDQHVVDTNQKESLEVQGNVYAKDFTASDVKAEESTLASEVTVQQPSASKKLSKTQKKKQKSSQIKGRQANSTKQSNATQGGIVRHVSEVSGSDDMSGRARDASGRWLSGGGDGPQQFNAMSRQGPMHGRGMMNDGPGGMRPPMLSPGGPQGLRPPPPQNIPPPQGIGPMGLNQNHPPPPRPVPTPRMPLGGGPMGPRVPIPPPMQGGRPQGMMPPAPGPPMRPHAAPRMPMPDRPAPERPPLRPPLHSPQWSGMQMGQQGQHDQGGLTRGGGPDSASGGMRGSGSGGETGRMQGGYNVGFSGEGMRGGGRGGMMGGRGFDGMGRGMGRGMGGGMGDWSGGRSVQLGDDQGRTVNLVTDSNDPSDAQDNMPTHLAPLHRRNQHSGKPWQTQDPPSSNFNGNIPEINPAVDNMPIHPSRPIASTPAGPKRADADPFPILTKKSTPQQKQMPSNQPQGGPPWGAGLGEGNPMQEWGTQYGDSMKSGADSRGQSSQYNVGHGGYVAMQNAVGKEEERGGLEGGDIMRKRPGRKIPVVQSKLAQGMVGAEEFGGAGLNAGSSWLGYQDQDSTAQRGGQFDALDTSAFSQKVQAVSKFLDDAAQGTMPVSLRPHQSDDVYPQSPQSHSSASRSTSSQRSPQDKPAPHDDPVQQRLDGRHHEHGGYERDTHRYEYEMQERQSPRQLDLRPGSSDQREQYAEEQWADREQGNYREGTARMVEGGRDGRGEREYIGREGYKGREYDDQYAQGYDSHGQQQRYHMDYGERRRDQYDVKEQQGPGKYVDKADQYGSPRRRGQYSRDEVYDGDREGIQQHQSYREQDNGQQYGQPRQQYRPQRRRGQGKDDEPYSEEQGFDRGGQYRRPPGPGYGQGPQQSRQRGGQRDSRDSRNYGGAGPSVRPERLYDNGPDGPRRAAGMQGGDWRDDRGEGRGDQHWDGRPKEQDGRAWRGRGDFDAPGRPRDERDWQGPVDQWQRGQGGDSGRDKAMRGRGPSVRERHDEYGKGHVDEYQDKAGYDTGRMGQRQRGGERVVRVEEAAARREAGRDRRASDSAWQRDRMGQDRYEQFGQRGDYDQNARLNGASGRAEYESPYGKQHEPKKGARFDDQVDNRYQSYRNRQGGIDMDYEQGTKGYENGEQNKPGRGSERPSQEYRVAQDTRHRGDQVGGRGGEQGRDSGGYGKEVHRDSKRGYGEGSADVVSGVDGQREHSDKGTSERPSGARDLRQKLDERRGIVSRGRHQHRPRERQTGEGNEGQGHRVQQQHRHSDGGRDRLDRWNDGSERSDQRGPGPEMDKQAKSTGLHDQPAGYRAYPSRPVIKSAVLVADKSEDKSITDSTGQLRKRIRLDTQDEPRMGSPGRGPVRKVVALVEPAQRKGAQEGPMVDRGRREYGSMDGQVGRKSGRGQEWKEQDYGPLGGRRDSWDGGRGGRWKGERGGRMMGRVRGGGGGGRMSRGGWGGDDRFRGDAMGGRGRGRY